MREFFVDILFFIKSLKTVYNFHKKHLFLSKYFFMTTENAIILHSILSGILVLGSPFIIMGFAFGSGLIAMQLSRGNWISGFGGIFLLCLLLYIVSLNIHGWYIIYNGQPHTYTVFLYPLYQIIPLFICCVIIWRPRNEQQ